MESPGEHRPAGALPRRPVALVAFLQAALARHAPQAEAKGLSLVYADDGALPACALLADDAVLRLLDRLLGGAVRAAARGGVRMSARHVGGRLMVAVEDTGEGRPDVDQANIEDCLRMAADLGADLDLRVMPGRGSVVRLVVEAAPVAVATGPLDGFSVLVVDDNRMNRELARAVLQSLGARVSDAVDGSGGVDAARVQAFDLILMDVQMPGLDGAEALARIRREGASRTTPVLAFTADADQKALASGHAFDGVVGKPISAPELLAGVLKATAARPAKDGAAAA